MKRLKLTSVLCLSGLVISLAACTKPATNSAMDSSESASGDSDMSSERVAAKPEADDDLGMSEAKKEMAEGFNAAKEVAEKKADEWSKTAENLATQASEQAVEGKAKFMEWLDTQKTTLNTEMTSLQDSAAKLSEKSQQRLQSTMDALSNQRERLEEKMTSLKDSGAEGFSKAQAELTEGYESVMASIANAAKEVESMAKQESDGGQ